MPGRLLNMETNGADGIKHVVNGKQSPGGAVQPADSSGTTTIPGLGKRNDTALPNGNSHIPGLGYPTPNGVSPSSPAKGVIPESMYDLPEEVVHIATDQHSLGALIQRVSAQCFNRMEGLVDELAKQSVPSAPPMTNGAGTHQQAPLSSSDEKLNSQKKTKILNFASDYRAKFIKLLVVTDWARRDVKDVSKLIDLKGWLMGQDDAALHAANSFYQHVMDARSFKISNPDLETALAVLSSGDVPWMPHFGYREQKKLDPREILNVLHRMNTIINLRLILHEDLIPQLRDYRVADGRATFTLPEEFELDVYVANEDPAQPWYFLDVRFLFEPAPQIQGNRLRASVDQTINLALAENGLKGAFELAHNFTLTHKINVFRKQGMGLQRRAWASALRIEMVRRTLTVQYWTESPQEKSWIEIGIVSGKDKSRRKKADDPISSQIKARWIRNKEQTDVQVPIDVANLSLERLLKACIARHSSFILETVRDSLDRQAATHSASEHRTLQLKLTTSETEPSDCALQARIGNHPTTTLQIDGITGRLYFSPAGPATQKAQEALERTSDPLKDVPPFFARYLTFDIQLRIDRVIENLGWNVMRHVKFNKEEAQVRMKRDVHRHLLFQPHGFKLSNWYIAYAINLCGESWWVLQIPNSTTGSSNPVTSQLKLPGSADDDYHVPLTLPALKKLVQSAVTAVSFITSNQALTAKGVSTTLKHIPVKTSSVPADAIPITLPVLIIRLSQLIKNSRFANDILQLRYLSFDADLGMVRLVAMGSLRDPDKMHDILHRTKDSDISFSPNGAFSIIVNSSIGTTPTTNVVAKLNTLGRLCNLVKTLRSHEFECKDISFSKVCFTFVPNEEVTLHFKPSKISLELPSSSPFRRVRELLEQILNDSSAGFEAFTKALSYFHPVLRGFAALDKRHCTHFPAAPIVLPRSVDFYRLTYPNPITSKAPLAAFELKFKRNKDELEWLVSDAISAAAKEEREKLVPGFADTLADFMKTVGKGWTGMRTLLVANGEGVEEALLQLDAVVWSALGDGKLVDPEEAERTDVNVKREIITID